MDSHQSPIKLAVLLQDLEFGGTQRYAVHLLKHLNRDLFEPELWVLRGGKDMLPAAQAANIPIHHMSEDSWVSPRALANLAARLLRKRPHILYTLTVVPNIWGRVFGRILRVPVIVSGYRSLLPKQHERWLWRFSDTIICNAEMLKQVMVERFSVDPSRIVVIPNAVDTDYFKPAENDAPKAGSVLFIGRLVAEKDPLNLLEGFRLAAREVPDATFVIMGNGSFKTEVEQRIAAYSLQNRVALVPAQSDIRPAMRNASVFTLPSASEASPNVVIEAMAMGLPIVGTRVGGIPELIEEGRTGLLVNPGDPRGLADALVSLLSDPDKARSMGQAGRERAVCRHSLEAMVTRTEEVFLEALRRQGIKPTEAKLHEKLESKNKAKK
jgi:glycosyltransferase involved in cell wall biosynthesis